MDSDREFFGHRHHHFGSANSSQVMLRELSISTGMDQDYVSSLLRKDGTLRMLNLCDDELDLPTEVQSYLNGYGDSTGLKAFRLAEPGMVPFEQLQGGNPDAVLALEMIRNHDRRHPLNILLYGPPGTGKTEFVRHIARTLGRNLVVRKASDLLGMFVGQTETNIAAAFEEAERTKSVLFFDEADSFLRDRNGAMQGHEVSKVNEILTRMENFRGIFIAATNFDSSLDAASRRRFALKLGFGYLRPEGIRHIWNVFFPDSACPDSVAGLPMLTPGDFNAVNGRLRYLPESARTASRIEAELRKELSSKDAHAGRTMGF